MTRQQYGISEVVCYSFSEVISRGNKSGPPHVKVVFEHQKRRFSKRALRVKIVENASFSFTNERTKTDVFDRKAHGMLAYFHRSSVFVWTGENDSNTLRGDAYFSENGQHVFKMSILKKSE